MGLCQLEFHDRMSYLCLSSVIFYLLQTTSGGRNTQIRYLSKSTDNLIKYYSSKSTLFNFTQVKVQKYLMFNVLKAAVHNVFLFKNDPKSIFDQVTSQ